jgi:hypothetical protein
VEIVRLGRLVFGDFDEYVELGLAQARAVSRPSLSFLPTLPSPTHLLRWQRIHYLYARHYQVHPINHFCPNPDTEHVPLSTTSPNPIFLSTYCCTIVRDHYEYEMKRRESQKDFSKGIKEKTNKNRRSALFGMPEVRIKK